ncbi:MAG: thiol:disulfide interchange protein [Betaproteobacteria bacterium RIFCSPLOWO2_12_FULL_65_14]|nr:MAG: thiol:disulfide interchange protein [Betaproteobacteria bacterium RIFCSPLOWO2_12_FULL_65_14]
MRRIFILLMLLAAVAPAAAQLRLGGAADNLLEPEKAFRFSARALDASSIEVSFAIADGYYMYRDRFKFALQPAEARVGTPAFPAALPYKDQFFGEVAIYRKQVRIRLPVEGAPGRTVQLAVTSQGCADVGVCYVPMESKVSLQMPAGVSEAPRTLQPQPSFSIFASDFDIARLFEGNVALVLGGFFVLGLLLTFTPCVLPMIPILSGIIAGEGKSLDKLRALFLSLAYVLGMAVAYAAAGVAAAFSGSLLAAALQNAWVLGAFALVFVVLALSMFGFYELRLPGFLHHRVHAAHSRLRGGRIASVAGMGVLSAVIVSPCVAAPLAGVLLYISQTRDVALGGAALFVMALGMGAPLVAMGVSEGALLPRAGEWMVGVRKFFGVLLLAVAIWVVSPVIPPAAQMIAWALLLIGSAIFLRAIDPLPATASGWWRLWKGAGVVALVTGVALLVGALSGSRDVLRPLAGLTQGSVPAAAAVPWVRVASVAELNEKLRAPGKPVMLDFYADWCVSCKEMEAFTFSDPSVRARMEGMLLLQADVTANDQADRELLKRFSLFGPPGIIFFDPDGREIKGLRVIGYQGPERFLKTLSLATAP